MNSKVTEGFLEKWDSATEFLKIEEYFEDLQLKSPLEIIETLVVVIMWFPST